MSRFSVMQQPVGLTPGILLAVCVAIHPGAGLAALKYETIRNVAYAEQGSQELRADIYQPLGKGPFPGVLCLHGGAWAGGNKSQITTIARRLAEHGYVAVSINYRLAPRDKFPAQINDCRAAVRWIRNSGRQYKIHPDRLAVWGYSSGGHLAALLGTTDNKLRAVVANGAPCDLCTVPPDSPRLAYWLGNTRRKDPDVYRRASPIEFASSDDPPMFFYHGRKDRVIRIAQPAAMVARLKELGVPAQLHVVSDAGHVRAFLDQDAFAAAERFLQRYLKADWKTTREDR